MEFVPVFQDDTLVRVEAGSLVQISVDQVQSGLEGRGAGAFVVDSLQRIAINGLESLANGIFSLEHAHGMGLEDALRIIFSQKSGAVGSSSKLRIRTAMEPIW